MIIIIYVLRHRLKTDLFRQSYPAAWTSSCYKIVFVKCRSNNIVIIRHYNLSLWLVDYRSSVCSLRRYNHGYIVRSKSILGVVLHLQSSTPCTHAGCMCVGRRHRNTGVNALNVINAFKWNRSHFGRKCSLHLHVIAYNQIGAYFSIDRESMKALFL